MHLSKSEENRNKFIFVWITVFNKDKYIHILSENIENVLQFIVCLLSFLPLEKISTLLIPRTVLWFTVHKLKSIHFSALRTCYMITFTQITPLDNDWTFPCWKNLYELSTAETWAELFWKSLQ